MANQKCLITGASRGLGHAILEAALQDGGKVPATARATVPARLLPGSHAWQVVEAEEQARHAAPERRKPVPLAADFDAVAPHWPSE